MNKGPAGVSEAVSDFSELFNNSDTSTLSLLDAKYAPKPQPPMVLFFDYISILFDARHEPKVSAPNKF